MQESQRNRSKRITIKTVSMMIAFNPHVTAGDFDQPVFVSNCSYNISFKSDHSLNDFLFWVFRRHQ